MDQILAYPMCESAVVTQALPLELRLDVFLGSIERRALRIAEMATRDRDEALDLVQEAMLRFVRKYRDRPEGEWAPLFHRVLDNGIRDWFRRQRVRGNWLVRLFSHSTEDDEGDVLERVVDTRQPEPARAYADSGSMAAIETALRGLAHRQRQVFVLRIWEGLDTRATADALGITEGSVKTHLSRALESLRSQLGDFHENRE